MLFITDELVQVFKPNGWRDGKFIIEHVSHMMVMLHGHKLVSALVQGIDQIIMSILAVGINGNGLLAYINDGGKSFLSSKRSKVFWISF